ncbi:2-oxoglutarate dehydrogenase, E2 component, dihydrolipoamide succinyltransferase, partial [Micrococcus flavus]
MSEKVTLPALGESVTEGTVTRWLKAVGDEVAVDEPLVEVSTDKVDTEIPSPVAGVLQEILAEEDETIEVGAALAVIGDGEASDDAGDAPAAESADEDAAEEAPADDEDEEPAGEPEPEELSSTGSADSDAASGSGESSDVTLPALGESVTEGTVTRWLKAVGDE